MVAPRDGRRLGFPGPPSVNIEWRADSHLFLLTLVPRSCRQGPLRRDRLLVNTSGRRSWCRYLLIYRFVPPLFDDVPSHIQLPLRAAQTTDHVPLLNFSRSWSASYYFLPDNEHPLPSDTEIQPIPSTPLTPDST